jgi:mannose-6-phosphate isomerase-like protein (cupin superfamily)
MQSTRIEWKPDESLFERVNGVPKGVVQVREALEAADVDTSKIITSRNPSLRMMKDRLRASLMPTGFEQHQLPIPLRGEDILCFITTGRPNAEFPEHRHSKNDGLRVVISGSIRYEGVELTAGDWMYVPRGAAYSFVAGSSGCTLFHSYPAPQDPK